MACASYDGMINARRETVMGKRSLADIFGNDYLNLMASYKARIQNILGTYDVAIFMARKAICLYNALKYNEEVVETKCRVISSRVIDYDSLMRFREKKVAVIDDVVVKGTSIEHVARKLIEAGVEADYYVVACEEQFGREFANGKISLQKIFTCYPQADIYQFSGLITQYIEASMCTFNVDSPIYDVTSDMDGIKKLLLENGAANLTSGLQQKFGIESWSLYLEYSGNPQSVLERLLKNSILKIRFYHEKGRAIAVPFVLLPKCELSELDELYGLFRNEELDWLVQCDDCRVWEENKLKVVSYLLSDLLFYDFVQRHDMQYVRDEKNDMIQFDESIDRFFDMDRKGKVSNAFSEVRVCRPGFSKFMFGDYMRSGYQYVANIDACHQPYENRKGIKIGRSQDGMDLLNKIIFSFDDILEGIRHIQGESRNHMFYVSSVVDVFIDMGMIVPSIVHVGSQELVRAYKMGEYSKLTRDQIRAFVKMLWEYQKNVNRSLDRTEFEKLCVLFFRTEINGRLFVERVDYEEGCYGICYSYYGPRVSSSQMVYRVEKDDALITDFMGRGMVRKDGNKKYIIPNQIEVEDYNLEIECGTFARDFALLNEVFENNFNVRRCDPHIHTLNQFLTILAIGDSPKNQILSLCAEVYQVFKIKIDAFLDCSYEVLVKGYKQVFSGIDSGIWKYQCFREKSLMRVIEKIKEYDMDAVRGIPRVYAKHDKGEDVLEFLDKCGRFLFRTAFVFRWCLMKKKRELLEGMADGEWVALVDEPKFMSNRLGNGHEDIREDGKQIIQRLWEDFEEKGSHETIRANLTSLKWEARHILDGCDVYLEKNNAYMKEISHFLVVHSSKGNLPKKFQSVSECILEGVTERLKTAVFSINYKSELCQLLDGLIIETQDIEDCEYLLVTLSSNDEGYYQIEDVGKGTWISRKIKEVFEKMHKLPNTKRRLFVLGKEELEYAGLMETTLKLLDAADFESNYKLYQYMIERKMEMRKTDGISIGTYIGENWGNVAKINQGTQCVTNQYGEKMPDILSLIEEVKKEANNLSDEERTEALEFVEVVENELKETAPKKSMIKTALEGLGKIVTNEHFVELVSKLAPMLLKLVN